MAESWTTFRELLLPPGVGGQLCNRGRSLELALREAIRTGRLHPGSRLPSSRDLASQLGLARGTVTAAYGQLVAEGYLVARHGSGTVVASTVCTAMSAPAPPDQPERWRLDLRPGLPALGAFPRAEWLAATRAGLAALPDEALGYPDYAGLPDLRAELAGYLGRVRAVLAIPQDVVITHGVAEGLGLLARVLRGTGHRTIAVENPSHRGQADLFRAHGLTPVPITVDDHGLRVDELAASGARAVLVTAAHQFPLGVVLHQERRRALLAWARDHDGLVIEDDYDAEHRYDRHAMGAVQALDPTRTAYLGSVSKVLAPALRIGWLIAPPSLREAVVTAKHYNDLGCGPLPQAALTHLLRTGGYERHLRRTRSLYRRRRDALLTAVGEHLPGWRPVGVAAGLHLVLRLPDGADDLALQRSLAANGVNALALSNYVPDGAAPPFPGLVVGYAWLTPDRLRSAVELMAAVWS
ncbi:PLP-dependent aminotransferase family protein [Kutzneria albida]|uniref:GntR family transcription regulator n=1 Tax=Kutzneria albida DSM 43870 TaxID=1449976 RepID=W5W7R6_9PSEU|nr:PLP-dependent aminotransferase family protein [Kutzneria albida]AHH94259.1 GntR family transcription regulator [Kutzneria albida DSM 43870]